MTFGLWLKGQATLLILKQVCILKLQANSYKVIIVFRASGIPERWPSWLKALAC